VNDIMRLLSRYPVHRWAVPTVNDNPDKCQRFMMASQFTRLAMFDDPYDFRTVVITGSNGKGSTGSILSRFLVKSGYRVGGISSPAIRDDSTDMVKVNGRPIPSDRFLDGLRRAERQLAPIDDTGELTHYMLICVAAVEYFRELGVDFVVAETAIGGMYDPTVPFEPDLCLFTNVTEEHQDVLGRTVTDIARHKSRIIGPGSTVILGEEITDEAAAVISSFAQQQCALVVRMGQREAIPTSTISDSSDIKILNGSRSCPEYQHPNLRLAAEAFSYLGVLRGRRLVIDLDESTHELFPENRFEFRQRNGVLYLFDSAHNEDGYRKLSRSLARCLGTTELMYIHGYARRELLESFRRIVRPERVEYVSGFHARVPLVDGFADLSSIDFNAIEAQMRNGVIVVVGTFLSPKVKAILFPENEDTHGTVQR
jgi:dihydrofolate synthase / folylpolyglutamate synthase